MYMYFQVATLLVEVLQDNPSLTTVYTSGVFFFILMYTGSNVLPIGKFLHLAHLQQSFRSEEVYITVYITFNHTRHLHFS